MSKIKQDLNNIVFNKKVLKASKMKDIMKNIKISGITKIYLIRLLSKICNGLAGIGLG
jgi:hypothetical protein